jgi:protein Tex
MLFTPGQAMPFSEPISKQLSLPGRSVDAALLLFEEGATIPFVARYRKERTGGLDEVQLRDIAELHRKLQELGQRRAAVREAIEGQGKLSSELRRKLEACSSKAELEDLYAPYKKRRKTRADNARARGLAPLAELVLRQPRQGSPQGEARRFVDTSKGVPDVESALAGARDIVAESIALEPSRRSRIRVELGKHGRLEASLNKKSENAAQFRDYHSHSERVERMPSHRYLAVCRGEDEGALKLKLGMDLDLTLRQLLRGCRYFPRSPFGEEFESAAEDALKRLLLPAAQRAVRSELKERADDEAINVFQKNLEALLLAAPLGSKPVLGVDPGIRTGCKCAMVDATGALADYQTLHLVGRNRPDSEGLLAMLRKHRPMAVAVGNGTGGREAEALVRKAVKEAGIGEVAVVSVNEAGASIYSASDIAREELPDVDLTVRGAVSIARRLQDPLAELVKLDPKSIGVGQYQHDVDQSKLERRLKDVVESCVNRVGVDVNTASAPLLAHVAGIGPKLAKSVVAHREREGAFSSRKEIGKVRGLGAKTYEQCAGFLRIPGGTNPLDASAVHPERYALVGRMAKDLGVTVKDLVGKSELLRRIDARKYQEGELGAHTMEDILRELAKPGRDPRERFEAAGFREDVHSIADLELGMELNGVVTNVTNFGAFVDIGVHRDGLVHISQLSDRYIGSPHEVVRAGQRIKVRVLEVDKERKRISLSAKSGQGN